MSAQTRTPICLRFLRDVKFPRFNMAVGEEWECVEEWGTGREYLEALEREDDRFPFAGGYCFVSDVSALRRSTGDES